MKVTLDGVVTEVEDEVLTTEEIYAEKMRAQTAAMSGTVRPSYEEALALIPVTLPDGTVSTLGEAVMTDSTAPFALLSKWVLSRNDDGTYAYVQVDDPTGIGSKDNPFNTDGYAETDWPLKDGAYYYSKENDTLQQYSATLTGGKFTTISN